MVSTKMDKTQAAEYATAPTTALGEDDGPAYSYGTRLCLDDELLGRLGITGLPAVGTRMQLVAVCEVIGANAELMQGETEHRIELQITDMELTPEQGASVASRMYPDKDGA
jgi:hypothetical protein